MSPTRRPWVSTVPMNWILRLILRLVVLAGIIWLVVWLVPGMHVKEANGVWTYLWLAVLFSLVNAILGPIFWFFSFPLVILTFGLFLLVVNAGLLAITAGLSSHLGHRQLLGGAVRGHC